MYIQEVKNLSTIHNFILAISLWVLALVHAWVLRHLDRALVAVVVLASTGICFGAFAFVMTHMVMFLGSTLSMIGFYNCFADGLHRTQWARFFFVIAISSMAKGPVAAVLTLQWYIVAKPKTVGFLLYFVVGEHYERFAISGWQGDLYGSGRTRATGIVWFYGLLVFLP